MDIFPTSQMTPIKTHDSPAAPLLNKTAKALAITQIALLALSSAGAVAFVIAAAVTLNAYLIIGVGICSIVAIAILGRNLCCRSIFKRDPTVFVQRHESLHNEQSFIHGFESPMINRKIPWPKESNVLIHETRLDNGRVLPRQR